MYTVCIYGANKSTHSNKTYLLMYFPDINPLFNLMWCYNK